MIASTPAASRITSAVASTTIFPPASLSIGRLAMMVVGKLSFTPWLCAASPDRLRKARFCSSTRILAPTRRKWIRLESIVPRSNGNSTDPPPLARLT